MRWWQNEWEWKYEDEVCMVGLEVTKKQAMKEIVGLCGTRSLSVHCKWDICIPSGFGVSLRAVVPVADASGGIVLLLNIFLMVEADEFKRVMDHAIFVVFNFKQLSLFYWLCIVSNSGRWCRRCGCIYADFKRIQLKECIEVTLEMGIKNVNMLCWSQSFFVCDLNFSNYPSVSALGRSLA